MLAAGLTGSASAATPGQGGNGGFFLLSFNLLYVRLTEGDMACEGRKAAVAAALLEADADIIALQEMETFMRGVFSDQNLQRDWVTAFFPDYGISANGQPRYILLTQPIF